MALEEGVVSENSSFYCGGSIPVLGRTDPVKCWKTAGHGSQMLTQAMQHSCNVALVQDVYKRQLTPFVPCEIIEDVRARAMRSE